MTRTSFQGGIQHMSFRMDSILDHMMDHMSSCQSQGLQYNIKCESTKQYEMWVYIFIWAKLGGHISYVVGYNIIQKLISLWYYAMSPKIHIMQAQVVMLAYTLSWVVSLWSSGLQT